MDGVRRLAGLARLAARRKEGVRQRGAQRRDAGRPLLPRRQRLHPGFRPDAQRQPGAWLALSARRLCRLRRRGVDRQLVPRRRGGRRSDRDQRGPASDLRLPEAHRGRIAADAGHDRHFDRRRRPDARRLGRQDLPVLDSRLAGRGGRHADRHRDQVERPDRHAALSSLSAGRSRGVAGDRSRPLAGAQQDQVRHDDPRRRRRSRHAVDGRRQRPSAVRRRLRDRRRSRGIFRRDRRLGPVRGAGGGRALSDGLARRRHRRRHGVDRRARRSARCWWGSPNSSASSICRPTASS